MDENWYAAEQEVRDRLSEARAAARIRTLTQGLAPAERRPHSVGIAFIRLARWVLARAMELASELSRALVKRSCPQPRVALVEGNERRREDTKHG
jgi:hypothetical protein